METEFNQLWHDMINGRIYDATHYRLIEMLGQTREKLWEFNNMRPCETEAQHEIIKNLLGYCGKNFHINQPFRCDYGQNISIGDNFFANFNLTILDEAPVTIGNNVFLGPNVSIYTACHPLGHIERRTRQEWAEPVAIGNDVWIGGGVTIVPGVTIGDRTVIGAGAVVTKDIPSDSVAVGNPAHVVKYLKKNADS